MVVAADSLSNGPRLRAPKRLASELLKASDEGPRVATVSKLDPERAMLAHEPIWIRSALELRRMILPADPPERADSEPGPLPPSPGD